VIPPLPPLPPLHELLESLRVVSIPMRVRFRGLATREAALLRGPAGWGEFSPFLEYPPAEAARWLAAACEAAWLGPPPAVRTSVPVNATVPAVPPAQVLDVISQFDGCRTAKVKVAESGQSLRDDVARVAEVRRLLGSDARIRVDANGAWSVGQARDALAALAAYGLEYAEQPCATVEDLRSLRIALARNHIDVPVAADESIRKADDPLRVAREQAADLVVVKVSPLGGTRRALEIVAECGLPAVVSSAIDTSVGIAAGVALAAALPELDHACGLGTVNLLAGDVAASPVVPVAGSIQVAVAREATADPQLLERWAAPPDRVQWWRARVAACHAEVAGGAV
jgi:O-succinylbenzoate synthase